jgi:hypothetical protein
MRIAVLLFLAVGLFSCTREIDLPLPSQENELVLNGLLHPDYAIQISLTTTLPLSMGGSNFPVVDNAVVKLYEDEAMVGNLTFQDSVYMMDYHPKVGHTYMVEAAVPGYPVVRASDKVPPPPEIVICFREDTTGRYSFSDAVLDVTIQDPVGANNTYWLETQQTWPKWPQCRFKEDSLVRENGQFRFVKFDTIVCEDNNPPTFGVSRSYDYKSFSPVPDRFNAYVDNISGGVTVYEGYVRVDDTSVEGGQIIFSLAAGDYRYLTRYQSIHERLSSTATVTHAGRHYDRYLKSSIIYYRNRSYSQDEEIRFKPFVQATQVYSNVENGTGIFAAYNSTTLEIGDFPCF